MKRYKFILAAALIATTANAQQANVEDMATKTRPKAAPSYLHVSTLDSQGRKAIIHRIQDTAAQPNAYVKRPRGTFYLGLNDATSCFWKRFLVYPPYANITFENGSADASSTTWYVGSTKLTPDNAGSMLDASNNFSMRYPSAKLANGKLSYSAAPLLVNGADSFSIADGVAAFATDPGLGFTASPLNEGLYYGGPYDDGSIYYYFGDLVFQGRYRTAAFYQPYDKPIGNLSLNEISLYAWSNGGDVMKAAPELKVTVYNVETIEGVKWLGDSVLATFTYVPDSVKYSKPISGFGEKGSTEAMLTFYPLADDGLGGKMIQPVDINQEFAVTVSGFMKKNVGFYFTPGLTSYTKKVTEYPDRNYTVYDYEESQPTPGRYLLVDTLTNNVQNGTWLYAMYPAVVLHGTLNYAGFDVSKQKVKGVEASFSEFTAPAAGGLAVNEGDYSAQLYTSLPWRNADGSENYTFNIDYDGEAPWLEGLALNGDGTYSIGQVVATNSIDGTKSFVNTANWNTNGIQVVGFSAQALPSGKTGRHAYVTVNANSYVSNRIVIRQGDDNTAATGIDNAVITDNAIKQDGRIFNLAGQQVTKSYKGIVISNGKKYVKTY